MRYGSRGMSVVEVMFTLAIAGILMGIAIPGFKVMTLNNRLAAQSMDFMSALQTARTEAIKRGMQVTVCRSANASACDTGGTQKWESGYIIYAETTGVKGGSASIGARDAANVNYTTADTLTAPIQLNDGPGATCGTLMPVTGRPLAANVTACADLILRAQPALSGSNTLRGNNNVANRVTFNAQGMLLGFTGTLRLCDSRGASKARWVRTSAAGQVRLCSDLVQSTTCNRNDIDDAGTALVCP